MTLATRDQRVQVVAIFAYPTVLIPAPPHRMTGDFISATDGSVNFGRTVGAVPSRGISFATWNDPAKPSGWAASATILTPSVLPLGFVATGLVNDAFTMTVGGGASAATVDVGTTSGSATLVYQADHRRRGDRQSHRRRPAPVSAGL